MSPSQMPNGAIPETEHHLLIVGSRGGGWTSVEALDPESGLALWAYEPHRELNDVACADGTVFVSTRIPHRADPNEPVRVVALRAHDGSELWRVEPAQIGCRMAVLRLVSGLRVALGRFSLRDARFVARSLQLSGTHTLMTDAGMLLASRGSIVFAFDTGTGALRWMWPVLSGQSRRLLAAHGGRFYVDGEPYGIHALDARTGKRLWNNERAAAVRVLAATEARVYIEVASKRGQGIVTISAADGAQERMFVSRPDVERVIAVSDSGIAFLLREQRLVAVRLDDERELWRGERLADDSADGWTHTLSLAVDAATHRLYCAYMRFEAGSRSSRMSAMDADSGATLWRWSGPACPPPMRGGVAVTAALGNAYVSLCDGIYAFRGGDGHLLWHIPAGYDQITRPTLVTIER